MSDQHTSHVVLVLRWTDLGLLELEVGLEVGAAIHLGGTAGLSHVLSSIPPDSIQFSVSSYLTCRNTAEAALTVAVCLETSWKEVDVAPQPRPCFFGVIREMAGVAQVDDHFLHGIHAYLSSLPEQTKTRLFDAPANCLAIFRCAHSLTDSTRMGMCAYWSVDRLLSGFARSVVLSLLWLDEALSLAQLAILCRKSEGKRLVMSTLYSFVLLKRLSERDGADNSTKP